MEFEREGTPRAELCREGTREVLEECWKMLVGLRWVDLFIKQNSQYIRDKIFCLFVYKIEEQMTQGRRWKKRTEKTKKVSAGVVGLAWQQDLVKQSGGELVLNVVSTRWLCGKYH